MQKTSLIPLIATFALFVGGCQLPFFGGGEEETTIESTESPVAVTPSPAQNGTNATPAQAPQTTATPSVPGAAAGLIASTDPNQRENEIKQGRPDPFSVFPTRVTVRTPQGAAQGGTGQNGGQNGRQNTGQQQEVPGRQIPDLPALPPIAQAPRFVRPPAPPAARRPASPNQQQGQGSASAGAKPNASAGAGARPGVPAGPNFIPQLPKVPQATLAQGVKVTGVIQVAGVPHAIVEAPGQEPRYVKAGDYLANGQVLVKRIDTRKGSVPVVILEEKGIEVAKRVGEGGVAATSPESAPGQAESPQQLNRISPG